MKKELQQIKDKYGEEMMHFCRENFSSILETEGLLFKLLSEHFEYSKELFNDIVKQGYKDNFKNYIYSFIKVNDEDFQDVNKSPQELLDEAGYNFYECHNEKEVQSFKKYYAKGEQLCTFSDNRLRKCYVFFAVKKDVDNIRRKDFTEPQRQDLYGTSVISIQFSKGNTNTLSIKNRYNHRVENPDSTFSNNLENIIPGLTKAFTNEYNLNIKSPNFGFELRNYCLANDKKFYKYDHEINNIYYCYNNTIIDNFNVKKFSKDRYIVFEHYILDLKEKTIKLYDPLLNDSFVDYFNNIEIEKIEVKKENNIKKIIINENIEVELDNYNRIASYKNIYLKEIKDNFLCSNKVLGDINIENVVTIGNNCLEKNKNLKVLSLPNVVYVGNNFLRSNNVLEELNMNSLKKAGSGFFQNNSFLKTLSFENLEYVGDYFFSYNRDISEVYLPNIIQVGNSFLTSNEKLKYISLPNLKYTGDYFISNNEIIENVYVPNLESVGRDFLTHNNKIEVLDMPKLNMVCMGFLKYNKSVNKVNLPSLKWIYGPFLSSNQNLEVLFLPSVEYIGNEFCNFNSTIKVLSLPNVQRVGRRFLEKNQVLNYIYAPNLPKDEYYRIASGRVFMEGNENEESKSNRKK